MHGSGVSKEDEIQEAQKIFQKLHKRPFRYSHCWDVLKFEQDWIGRSNNIFTPKRKAPTSCSSNQEPIDAREEIHDFNESDNNEMSVGRKAAKDKRKLRKDGIKDSAVLSNALFELKAEKKKAHEDRMLKYNLSVEQRVELLAIQKSQLEIQKAQLLLEMKERNRIKNGKLQLRKNREDMEIMMKDTSSMNSMQQEYFKVFQMEILQRMKTTF